MKIQNEKPIAQTARHTEQAEPFQPRHPGVPDDGNVRIAEAVGTVVKNASKTVGNIADLMNRAEETKTKKHEADLTVYQNDADRQLMREIQDVATGDYTAEEMQFEMDKRYDNIVKTYTDLVGGDERMRLYLSQRYTTYYKEFIEEGEKEYRNRLLASYDTRREIGIERGDAPLMIQASEDKYRLGLISEEEKNLEILEGTKTILKNSLLNEGLSNGIAAFAQLYYDMAEEYGDDYVLGEDDFHEIEQKIMQRNKEAWAYKKMNEEIIDSKQWGKAFGKFSDMVAGRTDPEGNPILLTFDEIDRAHDAGMSEEHTRQLQTWLQQHIDRLQERGDEEEFLENQRKFIEMQSAVTVMTAQGASPEDIKEYVVQKSIEEPFTGPVAYQYTDKLINYMENIALSNQSGYIQELKMEMLKTAGKDDDFSGDAETFVNQAGRYTDNYISQCRQANVIPDIDTMREGIQNLYAHYTEPDNKTDLQKIVNRWARDMFRGEGGVASNMSHRERFLEAVNNGDLAGFAGTDQQSYIDEAHNMQLEVMTEIDPGWKNKYDAIYWPSGKIIFEDKATKEQFHLTERNFNDRGEVIYEEGLEPVEELLSRNGIHKRRVELPAEGTVCQFNDNAVFVILDGYPQLYADAEKKGRIKYEKYETEYPDGTIVEDYVFTFKNSDGEWVPVEYQIGVLGF